MNTDSSDEEPSPRVWIWFSSAVSLCVYLCSSVANCLSGLPSVQADFAHAIREILGAVEDFYFYPHEIDGQIAPVDFRKTDGVLLRGDDDFGLALFAAVDDVEDFLLGEAVVIGEALGIDQVGAQFDEALLEAFRLGDAAQGGDAFAFHEFQPPLFAGENILKVERVVNALDNAGSGIVAGDALAELGGVAVALGDENGAGAGEMRMRFAQGAARQYLFVAERLLTINQHHVLAAARELPVVEPRGSGR